MRERHGRVLAELAETGMVMVRRLSDAMLSMDAVQTQVQIGLACHRVSRAVRQTMALEFRLAQEARREDREAAPPKPTPVAPPPSAASRPSPERVGWNEYERDDSDEAPDALDELLEAEDIDLEAVREAVETSMDLIRRDIAADPLLVKAGVLKTDAPAVRTGVSPVAARPRNRRSELMGAATFPRPAPAGSSPVWGDSG